MAVTVRIPTVLQKLTHGQDEISANGQTVGEVLSTVKTNYHELFARITTDEGAVRPFLNVFVNGDDFRAAGTNFGQAHVEWCVGIKPGDVNALGNGGTYTGVNLDADSDFELFVGFAPRCPTQSPSLSAPCIVSQASDGKKGSVTTGYLQGGDPPRRT